MTLSTPSVGSETPDASQKSTPIIAQVRRTTKNVAALAALSLAGNASAGTLTYESLKDSINAAGEVSLTFFGNSESGKEITDGSQFLFQILQGNELTEAYGSFVGANNIGDPIDIIINVPTLDGNMYTLVLNLLTAYDSPVNDSWIFDGNQGTVVANKIDDFNGNISYNLFNVNGDATFKVAPPTTNNNTVPEPTTPALVLAGLVAAGAARRKKA